MPQKKGVRRGAPQWPTGVPPPSIPQKCPILSENGNATSYRILPENGNFELQWHSNLDGYLGSGRILRAKLSGPKEPCNPEYLTHEISLKIINNEEIFVNPITLNVGQDCD